MRFPVSIQLPVAVILAGGAGYWLGHHHSRNAVPAPDTARWGGFHTPGTHREKDAAAPGTAESLLSPALRKLLGESALSDSTVRSVTAHVLEEPSPSRRAAAIGLILESMTPSNASAIRLAFIDSTTKTGRIHNTEWFLMIRKFGETLGQAALDEIGTNDSQAATALEGWAMSAPEAALAHLQSQDRSGEGYAGKWMALLSGVARTDPAKSFQLALADPEGPLNAEALIESAVQSAGMTGAAGAMQKALDSAGPEVAQNPAFLKMFDALTSDMFHQNWISGQSEKMLPWLEQQKGEPFINGEILSHAAMDTALQGKVTETLDWLDRMSEDQTGGSPGDRGLRSAVMRDPSVLSKVDEATLGRVIARFPSGSNDMTFLADALEASNPAYAKLLRAAGP